MATLDTVVIRIVSDTKDIKKTTDVLKEQGKVEEKNIKIFEEAGKKRKALLAETIKDLERVKRNRKSAFDVKTLQLFDKEIADINKDIKILEGNVESLDKTSDGLGNTLGSIGKVLVGAFAVKSILNFGEHLLEVGTESEAFEKRAQTVFGNSLEIVEKFAEQSAKSLGLTEVGFLGAAAAIGDILVPLGLSRERAAEMSVEAVKLGGALKEFTGDSRSAAEISNIVARSLTGEVEGLKTLGVVIDQTSIQFKDLVKSKQVDLGLTQQQAKAEAIFQIAIDSSGDALKSFETNTNSLARQQAILTATLEEQTEHLAELLTPAFLAALKGINSFSKTTKDLIDDLVIENKEFAIQGKEISTLINRHDKLASQTELNAEEQEELKNIIQDLAGIVPQAATEFDRFGNALEINTDIVIANLKQQQKLLLLRNAERIRETREEIEDFTGAVDKNTESLNKGFTTIVRFSKAGFKATTDEVKLTAGQINNLRNENTLLNADIADLLLGLEELGIELTDVEKDFIDAALGTDRFKKSIEDSDGVIKEQVRNIFFLKNAISELRKEQAAQNTSTQRIAQITRELIPLQKELNDLLGKDKASDPIELLSKRISELRKELLNQALAGNVSKDTIKELNEAVDVLTSAEIELKIALTDTLDPLEAQKLGLDKIGDSAQTIGDLVKDFQKIQREEIEATTEKRLEAIGIASDAEQQAFRILAQINTNKLIAIDNEEIRALRSLEKQGLSEEELAKKRTEILERTDRERAKILTRQAQQDKIAAIISATINTAVEVTKVLANPALAALVAALGLLEIAVIASQPIPEFHEGKKPELKEGEMYAKILKTESIIPPEQSKKYKGAIDSMIDHNFDNYVMQEYMLPIMKNMGKDKVSDPFNDVHLWSNQRKQIKLMQEGNTLAKTMIRAMESSNRRRSWH